MASDASASGCALLSTTTVSASLVECFTIEPRAPLLERLPTVLEDWQRVTVMPESLGIDIENTKLRRLPWWAEKTVWRSSAGARAVKAQFIAQLHDDAFALRHAERSHLDPPDWWQRVAVELLADRRLDAGFFDANWSLSQAIYFGDGATDHLSLASCEASVELRPFWPSGWPNPIAGLQLDSESAFRSARRDIVLGAFV